MANFAQISEGLQRGYVRGRQAGGGRLGALGSVISKVASGLKAERVAQQDITQKKGLLGYSALLQGKIEPTTAEDVSGLQIPGMGRFKPVRKPTKYGPEALEFERAKAGIGLKSSLGKKDFHADVRLAQEQIGKGEDPFKMFQMLSQKYPKDSTWIKRQLIKKGAIAQSLDALLEELQ